MTLTLVVTFWSGDAHRIPALFKALALGNYQGINQIVLVCSGTNYVISSYSADILGIPNSCDFVVIESTIRRSQATARNLGISAATSDLVSFHDGDDLPHPHKFLVVKHVFNSLEKLDWLCHDTVSTFDELVNVPVSNVGLNLLTKPYATRYGEAPSFSESSSASGASALVLRARVLKTLRYSEKAEDYRHEDTEFIWRVFANGFIGAFLQVSLSTYVSSQGCGSMNTRSIGDLEYFARFIDGDRESLIRYLTLRGAESLLNP